MYVITPRVGSSTANIFTPVSRWTLPLWLSGARYHCKPPGGFSTPVDLKTLVDPRELYAPSTAICGTSALRNLISVECCLDALLLRSWETNMRRKSYRSRRRKRFIRVGERILRIS